MNNRLPEMNTKQVVSTFKGTKDWLFENPFLLSRSSHAETFNFVWFGTIVRICAVQIIFTRHPLKNAICACSNKVKKSYSALFSVTHFSDYNMLLCNYTYCMLTLCA